MSPDTHVTLGFVAQAVPVVTGGVWLVLAGPNGSNFFVVMAVAITLAIAFGYAWRGWVSARCPLPGCGGDAWCHDAHPISFTCRRCGHTHATRFHMGSVQDN